MCKCLDKEYAQHTAQASTDPSITKQTKLELFKEKCAATHKELDITECLWLFTVIKGIAMTWAIFARRWGTRADESKTKLRSLNLKAMAGVLLDMFLCCFWMLWCGQANDRKQVKGCNLDNRECQALITLLRYNMKKNERPTSDHNSKLMFLTTEMMRNALQGKTYGEDVIGVTLETCTDVSTDIVTGASPEDVGLVYPDVWNLNKAENAARRSLAEKLAVIARGILFCVQMIYYCVIMGNFGVVKKNAQLPSGTSLAKDVRIKCDFDPSGALRALGGKLGVITGPGVNPQKKEIKHLRQCEEKRYQAKKKDTTAEYKTKIAAAQRAQNQTRRTLNRTTANAPPANQEAQLDPVKDLEKERDEILEKAQKEHGEVMQGLLESQTACGNDTYWMVKLDNSGTEASMPSENLILDMEHYKQEDTSGVTVPFEMDQEATQKMKVLPVKIPIAVTLTGKAENHPRREVYKGLAMTYKPGPAGFKEDKIVFMPRAIDLKGMGIIIHTKLPICEVKEKNPGGVAEANDAAVADAAAAADPGEPAEVSPEALALNLLSQIQNVGAASTGDNRSTLAKSLKAAKQFEGDDAVLSGALEIELNDNEVAFAESAALFTGNAPSAVGASSSSSSSSSSSAAAGSSSTAAGFTGRSAARAFSSMQSHRARLLMPNCHELVDEDRELGDFFFGSDSMEDAMGTRSQGMGLEDEAHAQNAAPVGAAADQQGQDDLLAGGQENVENQEGAVVEDQEDDLLAGVEESEEFRHKPKRRRMIMKRKN
eukprot:g1757.t1